MGDHHPDLHVWDLYNHHEVSPSFPIFVILLGVSIPSPVKMAVFCVGSTDLCAAWWRDTAAWTVSRVWTVCGGRPPWATRGTPIMTWCRWSQVLELAFVRVHTCTANKPTDTVLFYHMGFGPAKTEVTDFLLKRVHRLVCGGGSGLSGWDGWWRVEHETPQAHAVRGKPSLHSPAPFLTR